MATRAYKEIFMSFYVFGFEKVKAVVVGGFTRGLLQSVIAGLVPVIHLSAGLEGSGVEGVARLSEHLTVEDAEGWIPGTSPRMTLLGVEVLLGVGCFRVMT